MFEEHHSDGTRGPQPEAEGDVPPVHPSGLPVRPGDTQPVETPSPDDVETAELPGELGEPTIAVDRVPTGATPTASLPRTVPPPQRSGYVPPRRSTELSRGPHGAASMASRFGDDWTLTAEALSMVRPTWLRAHIVLQIYPRVKRTGPHRPEEPVLGSAPVPSVLQ